MAADHRQVDHVALLADDRGEVDDTRDARLLGERRIHRARLPDQLGLLYIAPDGDALGSVRRGRNASGDTTGNAADDSTDYTTRNATRNTTDDPANYSGGGRTGDGQASG